MKNHLQKNAALGKVHVDDGSAEKGSRAVLQNTDKENKVFLP